MVVAVEYVTMSKNALGKADSRNAAHDKRARVDDPDWIREKYWVEGLTLAEVADLTDYSTSKLTNKMDEFDIDRRSSGKPLADERLTDAEWFRTQYHENGLTTRDIADLIGCSRPTACKWKRVHDIESRGEYKSRGEGVDNPNGKEKHIRSCAWCGETLELYPKRTKRAENNFCNVKCYGRYVSKHRRGEDHPLYRGGGNDYGMDWNTQRNKARKQDNHTCQGCGVCESNLDQQLDVHHIVPFKEFDDPSDANELDNLVSLCRPCHRKWEGVGLRPMIN